MDIVKIVVEGGAGGDGSVSFLREKFRRKGGPDGGDGGRGGNVLVVGEASVETLAEVSRRRVYRAGRGGDGMGRGMNGRNGEDLRLRVPLGTMVYKQEADGRLELLADVVSAGQAVIVARGGRGGRGNARFATPTNQVPRIAERGQRGEQARLWLELKLMCHVGIVALPNAGKSSLLAAMSGARPKIEGYPFTTVTPVLGVVEHQYRKFIVVELPALVEGSHRGAGLGQAFLRHAERAHVLLHVLDGTRAACLGDMMVLNGELLQYGRSLPSKEQVVVVNKIDLPEVRDRVDAIGRALTSRGIEPFFVSAASGEGLPALVAVLAEKVEQHKAGVAAAPEPVYRGEPRRPSLRVSRQGGVFEVEGEAAVALAEMMPLEREEGRAEFWRRLRRMGVVGALRRAGVEVGDKVRFGRVEVEWEG